ncbi:ESX secretion-associated protein EspG [Nocardia camponoti]|uniref:ESX secretion-associated protein EspG n=1 Tax=Nocardia camponoti TaxID=1616106 RepID=A0A917QRY9_9NOCA|nr:ESX secretion-associated protein EspG [Nocardia camponoti]GGK65637.1 hypothetical protein GCM10011591_42290 [Nocardia camponoti]
MSWTFTPDEFVHVWNSETRTDRVPFPLTMGSVAKWADEGDALAAAAQRRYPTGADDELSAVLRLAAAPETTLALFHTAGEPVRVYGACAQGRGAVLHQTSTGAVELFAGSANMVARAIATFMGDEKPGRTAPLREDMDRVAAFYDDWHRPANAPTAKIDRLTRARRHRSGHIEVHPRPGAPANYLTWFDVTGDGRYLSYHHYNEVHLRPADKSVVVEAILKLAQI